jgi:hypothetical protein
MNNPAPHSLEGWLSFRAANQHNLADLDLPTLAVLYGLSWRAPYSDAKLRRQVETVIENSPDPLYTRFMLAYHAATYYDDISSSWGWGQVANDAGETSYDFIPEGQPGFIAPPPPDFIEQVKHWLIEGIQAFREDRGRIQLIHWIKYRIMAGDSYLTETDAADLEAALGYEIRADADPYAQELARHVLENFDRLNKGRQDSQPSDQLGDF